MHNRLHNHFKPKQTDDSSAATAIDEAVANIPSSEGLTVRASRSLASHPAIAIGAAFAVGLLIGKWVKR